MLVKDLDQMENIVAQNQSLSWDGWNIVELTKSSKAIFSNSGVFVNGSWFIKKVFVPDREGWRIPVKYAR